MEEKILFRNKEKSKQILSILGGMPVSEASDILSDCNMILFRLKREAEKNIFVDADGSFRNEECPQNKTEDEESEVKSAVQEIYRNLESAHKNNREAKIISVAAIIMSIISVLTRICTGT